MSEILEKAISACQKYPLAFCKFISANDAGTTGTHQSGIYIPKNAYKILFDSIGEKGENKDKYIKIKWQDDFETESRFIWYGKGTRSEYRITRFGRGFPFLREENVGDLFILVKVCNGYYLAYIINSDEEIENFLATFAMSSSDTNRLITTTRLVDESMSLDELFIDYIAKLQTDFPTTYEIAKVSREIYNKIKKEGKLKSADYDLIKWLDIEYELFKSIERDRYSKRIATPFKTIDELVECANTLLNRRKSRAGKSLEHHLGAIFTRYSLKYTAQANTEGNKKPDFIFPSEAAYHDLGFNSKRLTFLGAKTTCKDRWRQILNEADRIENKHLFTLQQGISKNQLMEMYDHKVTLVVPKSYISSFPNEFKGKILSLEYFIQVVKSKN